MSGGARVELDLSYMKAQKLPYSLFPGQIVAVEGMNCSGRKLVAQRICEGAPHAPEKTSVGELLKFHYGDDFQGGEPLVIIAASGPFTCSDNLEYEPLRDLLYEVKEKKVDIVILNGPFVDTRQKDVASGQPAVNLSEGDSGTIVPFECIFLEMISKLIEEFYLEYAMETQFVLIPSLDDATAEWVYPQAPFASRRRVGVQLPGSNGVTVGSLGLDEIELSGRSGDNSRRVHCLANPCTLKINEVVIGATGTDVLFHLNADETNANLELGSRMSHISQHLVQQRSFYPLFPGSLGMNRDMKRFEQWSMPCAPDILILPSKLAPFCKSVVDDSTLVVNPGLLTKATTGGTYAVITVHPIARGQLDNAGGDDVEMKHSIQERTRIEIKRI
jgi:DNA polymerase alpha subunit B